MYVQVRNGEGAETQWYMSKPGVAELRKGIQKKALLGAHQAAMAVAR